MLVLSRQAGEAIVIDTGKEIITVTIAEVRGKAVRLGFDAKDGIKIDRLEVYKAKIFAERKNQCSRHADPAE